MKDGFVRVAAITPSVRVADIEYNKESIKKHIKQEYRKGTKIAVFPELCITAYTCNDLFFQSILIDKAKEALAEIIEFSRNMDMLICIGIPWEHNSKLYNTISFIKGGKLLGLVPKKNLPNYNEFYEVRYFTKGMEQAVYTDFFGQSIPMGINLLFRCENMRDIVVGAEVCEDLWVPNPPSICHAMAGANIIVNSSASNALACKKEYREGLVVSQSARLVLAYIYANAGEGESTQDLVFSGHNLIAENGVLLAATEDDMAAVRADIDVDRLSLDRKRLNTFEDNYSDKYTVVDFKFDIEELELSRYISSSPFIPASDKDIEKRCEEILNIQVLGLKKRLAHIGAKKVVLGISGGLDSTLAIIVAAKTFDMAGIDRQGILAVTMPGFGTTDRTYNNACKLTRLLGAKLEEINISEAILLHFRDIGHDVNVHNITYENAQARERTQILMDIANRDGSIVIGTGDLSELALGWATYNGDHMSMYAVNSSVPKTLIRYLVKYYADISGKEVSGVLYDILSTPVSPELLPSTDGNISQKTEDLVGPYELHDFFLYYLLRYGFAPKKIYRLAKIAFENKYSDEIIHKWLSVFYKRFFSQQFKRSCMPDGPKVGTVALSPRGDLRMPSDAMSKLWLKEVEGIR